MLWLDFLLLMGVLNVSILIKFIIVALCMFSVGTSLRVAIISGWLYVIDVTKTA